MSLQEFLKDRIINNIIKDAKGDKQKWYSLICADDVTIEILTHVFKMHELNDMSIGLVVNVTYPRERVKISPIYFLSPNVDSVKRMCEDYKDTKNTQYNIPVHLYFCGPTTPAIMDVIKQSEIRRYLATCKEVYCQFHVLEKRVFSFKRDSAFSTLYINKADIVEELSQTAQQLVALLLTLDEDPYIRFTKASRRAEQLSGLVVQKLTDAKQNLQNWKPNEQRATLIILDRSDDPLTPLLHEMTYQAMIMDLLADSFDGNGKLKVDDNDEKAEVRDLPDENDEIWVQYRHQYIGDVVSKLPEQFKKWENENEVVKLKKSKTDNNAVDSKKLIQAARDMPQFQLLVKQYNTNINLAHKLTKVFKQYKLQDVVDLEQDIATGIDSNGHECNRVKIQQRLSNEVLSKMDFPQELKLRLFMLYIIAQGGMKPNERKNLVEQCKFDENANNVIFNFGSLGVALQTDRPVEGHKNKEYWKAVQKDAKAKSENSQMITRYLSYLDWILTQHANNTLSSDDFVWISEPDNKDSNNSGKVATSYRRQRKTVQQNQNNSQVQYSNPRIIVYVLGGISYSELRTCYHLSDELKRDIYVGSTSLINPKKYLELLSVKSSNN